MSEASAATYRIGIVGAGVAGLATATALLNLAPGRVRIDLIDRRPTPFGMLRHGVAPDQPSGRDLLIRYAAVFDAPDVRFLGLVDFGTALTREDVLASYDAVIYATGAPADHLLDLPGEALPGVRSGRAFAEWYTGTPGVAPFDLSGVTSVAIVGLGDVAVDLARILLVDPARLRETDMPEDVWQHLSTHRVRDVTLLVRRGPGDCQLKKVDLERLLNLPGVAVRFDKAALEVDEAALTQKARSALPVWRAVAAREVFGAKARLRIRFWTRPLELRGGDHLEGIRIEQTRQDRAGRLLSAGGEDHIPAQLLLRATGARGVPLPGVPFDARAGVLPTVDHRVVDAAGVVQPGEYAAGWVANGWKGGFGTQRRDGEAVAQRVIADLERHSASIDTILAERGVRPLGIEGWRHIEDAERILGVAESVERMRISDLETLEAVARGE